MDQIEIQRLIDKKIYQSEILSDYETCFRLQEEALQLTELLEMELVNEVQDTTIIT